MSKVGDSFEYTITMFVRMPILYTFDDLEDGMGDVTERDVEYRDGEAYETEVPPLYGYVHVAWALNRHWFNPQSNAWIDVIVTN